jgi:hypothetical protein
MARSMKYLHLFANASKDGCGTAALLHKKSYEDWSRLKMNVLVVFRLDDCSHECCCTYVHMIYFQLESVVSDTKKYYYVDPDYAVKTLRPMQISVHEKSRDRWKAG